ncbi:hypothetical protein EZV62_009057 [Acer yangbiense]|uniref:Ubiquitin thioesterase OTU n=1 Tax=Acer yangbiense TaxID=1000413 RepID=A0A5C7IFM7_9ROSI|nr:hypothetical protein EZV62_009057 [Acer yangbiense]
MLQQERPQPHLEPIRDQAVGVQTAVDQPAAVQIHGRTIRIEFPVFNGEDLMGWIFRAEKYQRATGITEAQLMTLAAAHLTGDTIPWYQWLERTIGNLCWPQFTRALSTRFGTLEEADPGGALSKLSQNGTVKDYQVQFERLSNRTRGLPESFLISCFLSGLREELKANVQILKPITLAHAFELAKLQEEAHIVITKQTTVVTDQTTPRSSPTPVPSLLGPIPSGTPPIRHYDADVPSKKLRLSRNERQRRWLVSLTEDGFDRSGWTKDLGSIRMGGQRIWEFRNQNGILFMFISLVLVLCFRCYIFQNMEGIVARRVIPSDNSCLFNAVGYVVDHDKNKAPELRQGAIELSILADYYGREIAAYDIQTTRCDWYGQEKKYSERVMLIYDGLHYDALAMSPFDGAPEEFDQTIFPVRSDRTIGPAEGIALNLVKEQQIIFQKRSFTDTARFTLRCGVCQIGVVGQKNLLSVAQLLKKGYSCSFEDNYCTIVDSCGVEVVKVGMHDNSFPLNLEQVNHSAFVSKLDDFALWHKRYGHFNMDALKYLQDHDMVRDMQETSRTLDDLCDACQLGKMHRKPFSSENVTRAKNKAVQGKTPVEAWSGIKPSAKHLKVFGSIYYSHVADAKRSKLDDKAEMGIFLGYAANSKGYRVFNLQAKKLIISRDIQVDEDAYWDWENEQIRSVKSSQLTTIPTATDSQDEVVTDIEDKEVESGSLVLKTKSLAEIYERCAIELSILADYYGREIAAYDIQTARCDLYGQEKKYLERVMLIYDGLHYDALAMSPFDGTPEEFDQTIFPVRSDRTIGPVEGLALNLVKEQHRKRSFTDTARFTLRCGVYQIGVVGQKEAVEHAQATGHVNFQEYR